jgi:FdhE protein
VQVALASITRFGGAVTGQRYLHCALCHTEWHLLRGVCAHCGQREGLSWRSLQGLEADSDGADSDEAAQDGQAAVQGEACDACGHYLKLLHGDRDAQLDPVADDLATLTLDLLLGDEGLQRHGANLMLLFGEGEAAHDDPPSSSGSG